MNVNRPVLSVKARPLFCASCPDTEGLCVCVGGGGGGGGGVGGCRSVSLVVTLASHLVPIAAFCAREGHTSVSSMRRTATGCSLASTFVSHDGFEFNLETR